MHELKWILAQTEGPAGDGEGQTTVPGAESGGSEGDATREPLGIIWPIMLMMVVMFIFLRPNKRKKQHQTMLAALKRNDRIQSIGGILATVVEVREKEVVIKIDESNNSKMRLARSAISKVFAEGEE